MYSSAVNDEPSLDGNGADFDEPAPNLEVIYQAFGEHADLYKDVLQVKSTATAEQIQMAYFDRRSELFALLASIDSEEEQDDITASHRFHAERKMDAVVMAVRILGDPQLRQEYDNVVVLRQTKKQPKEPPSGAIGASRASSNREPDGVYAGVGVAHGHDVPPSPRRNTRNTRSPKRRSPKRRSRRISPSDNEASDDAKNTSDEMMLHHQFHNQEPDYDFIRATGSKGSKSSSTKHRVSHKKKHQDHHHSSHAHHDGYHDRQRVDQSTDQSTLNQTIDTFPDSAVNFLSPVLNDDATIESRRTWEEGTVEEGTVASDDWTRDTRDLARGGTSTLSNVTNQGFISRIQEEVAGTVEDTLVSFEQVLNVFTLQERDILAVMGRIDKAKRQLRKRR